MQELFELSARMVTRKNRMFRRYMLSAKPFESGLTILLGQRGVGKTTMLVQYLLDRFEDAFSEQFLYVPMDHFIVGTRKMYDIADEYEKLGGKLICFDEIHKYPDWSAELKSINDSFPNLQVIASGSSALAIHRGSHDLSRRAIVRRLHPMSLREWLSIKGFGDMPVLPLPELLSSHRPIAGQLAFRLREQGATIMAEFATYLRNGYYPYSFEHENTPGDFLLALEQSVHTTIENDLAALFPALTGASIHKIKQLLATVSGLVPFKPDLAGLKRSLDIGDQRTLKTYIKHLEDAGIVRSLHRPGKSLNNLDKPEKLYLDNPNLMLALAGENAVNIGNMRETFMFSCFRKEPIHAPERGDFQVDEALFEVGGRNKDFQQIANRPASYLALDQIEIGAGNRIPLWLFGFLY